MIHGSEVPEIDARAVSDDAFLVDVREDDEWEAGHAPTAAHIPLGELSARVDEVPRDQDVYVVCRSGARSAQAAAFLNGAGWKATNVAGGMNAWAKAGRPMRSETGTPPEVI